MNRSRSACAGSRYCRRNRPVSRITSSGLLVIALVSNTAPEIVCAIYLVLIALAAMGARAVHGQPRQPPVQPGRHGEALRYKHSWVMSFLYIGTFGSFIGFSFAFGQVLQINFLAGGDNAAQASLHAAQIAFIGPLLGSISSPFGGKAVRPGRRRKGDPLHVRRDDLRGGHPGRHGALDDGAAEAPTGGRCSPTS